MAHNSYLSVVLAVAIFPKTLFVNKREKSQLCLNVLKINKMNSYNERFMYNRLALCVLAFFTKLFKAAEHNFEKVSSLIV